MSQPVSSFSCKSRKWDDTATERKKWLDQGPRMGGGLMHLVSTDFIAVSRNVLWQTWGAQTSREKC